MVQDHMHMLIKIPPKYLVSEVVGYTKNKSAIAVARQFSGRKRNFDRKKFWARGYASSTVGFETKAIQKYVNTKSSLMGSGQTNKATSKLF
jgi:putative transposase